MDWHPEDIKAEIRKAGGSLAALARREGVSTQALSIALHARVSARCERVIALFLDRHPHEIWPSRYGKDGQRLSGVAARAVTAKTAA